MSEIILTEEQNNAIDMIRKWYYDSIYQTFVLSGVAGTGKTTILKHIANALNISNIAYCSFTGKAARVMTNKGTPATTIHSLIYTPREQKDKDGKKIVIFELAKTLGNIELIVVDEASTIGKAIQQDLESFDLPILYIGDHGQLPPISDTVSNLMLNPNVKLESVHRQALDNPIIWCANQVRQGIYLPYGKYGNAVLKTTKDKISIETLSRANQILCGKNSTRTSLNEDMRKYYNFKSIYPQDGDKMICLQNEKNTGLVNGMTGICKFYNEKTHKMDFISDEDEEYFDLKVDYSIFKKTKSEYKRGVSKFDYGYAVTTHKFQGSEAENVIIFEEQFGDDDFHSKWLYTAITRASQKLIIVS